jgi:hypothetical protein
MAPLPKGFSFQATPIRAALSEGRKADAVRLVTELLRTGKADPVVQGIAADLIAPRAKRGRGRPKSLPAHWLEIGEEFGWKRDYGVSYEDAIEALAKKFGYSATHVRSSIKIFDAAKDAHEEATAEYYE